MASGIEAADQVKPATISATAMSIDGIIAHEDTMELMKAIRS